MITREVARLFASAGEYDVAVMGAGPGGIGAAVAAARKGLKTILIEQYGFAGGAGTLCCVPLYFGEGGLCYQGIQISGGLSDEVVRRLDAKGKVCMTTDSRTRYPDHTPIKGRELTRHVISDVDSMRVMYNELLNEAGVECLFYSYLVDAVVEDRRIVGALVGRIEGPGVVWAKTFIDATGDALLVHYAGGETREYSDEYNMHKSLFFYMGNVGPYDREYAEMHYKELFACEKTPKNVLEIFLHMQSKIPGVTQIAFGKASGTPLTSAGMTKMERDLRAQQMEIADFMRREMPGFQNAETVFTSIRVGVRFGRGIVGVETLTPELLEQDSLPENRVALIARSYGTSHSNKTKFADDWARHQDGLSGILHGTLISRSFSNVLACGRAISSHPALSATFRLMPTCIQTGEAAGLLAALAIRGGCTPVGVEYASLRREMDHCRFILD